MTDRTGVPDNMDNVLDFIRRGQAAQAAVDELVNERSSVTDQPECALDFTDNHVNPLMFFLNAMTTATTEVEYRRAKQAFVALWVRVP